MNEKPTVTLTSGTRERSQIYTSWLTRDADRETGLVSPRVRVWLAMPDRHEVLRGAFWSAPDLAEPWADWPLEVARSTFRTVPDDARQCVRVEGDLVKSPEDQVVPASIN
jgi:hypothetical protein